MDIEQEPEITPTTEIAVFRPQGDTMGFTGAKIVVTSIDGELSVYDGKRLLGQFAPGFWASWNEIQRTPNA